MGASPVVRRALVAVLVTVAVVGVPVTLAAGWAHRVVSDPDAYSSVMARIADDPELRSVASAEVSDRLLGAVDVEALVRRSLDATLGPAGGADRVREALVAASTSLLRATVRDAGPGGAQVADGSGLRGIADRLSVVDGRLFLSSPPGGPTILTVEVPCA